MLKKNLKMFLVLLLLSGCSANSNLKNDTEEATVVVASRYMEGGTSTSNHVLKSLLSFLGSLSLRTLIRLPVHDATNSTRLYRRSFLNATQIESTQGFEVTLELLLKAHLNKNKIIQVPIVWRDRTIGVSKFKFLKWLPAYLGWYMWGVKRYWLS